MNNEKFTMPFTNEDPQDLASALDYLKQSPLPIETFDAFLHEYSMSHDLSKAVFFAQCEWDC